MPLILTLLYDATYLEVILSERAPNCDEISHIPLPPYHGTEVDTISSDAVALLQFRAMIHSLIIRIKMFY